MRQHNVKMLIFTVLCVSHYFAMAIELKFIQYFAAAIRIFQPNLNLEFQYVENWPKNIPNAFV